MRKRHERQGGVAQPAEAVIPIARAADLLGQRSGGRRDYAPGGRVGECLEGDRRACRTISGHSPASTGSVRTMRAKRPRSPARACHWIRRCRCRPVRCLGASGKKGLSTRPPQTSNPPTVRQGPRRARGTEPQRPRPCPDRRWHAGLPRSVRVIQARQSRSRTAARIPSAPPLGHDTTGSSQPQAHTNRYVATDNHRRLRPTDTLRLVLSVVSLRPVAL